MKDSTELTQNQICQVYYFPHLLKNILQEKSYGNVFIFDQMAEVFHKIKNSLTEFLIFIVFIDLDFVIKFNELICNWIASK